MAAYCLWSQSQQHSAEVILSNRRSHAQDGILFDLTHTHGVEYLLFIIRHVHVG
uniref:Uncharacterized protein n=1 Tax=Hyaloperonospora arabidopsidis (strain Emoy2) TaxID=559515 RepID=M4BIJ3_HYAAE